MKPIFRADEDMHRRGPSAMPGALLNYSAVFREILLLLLS